MSVKSAFTNGSCHIWSPLVFLFLLQLKIKSQNNLGSISAWLEPPLRLQFGWVDYIKKKKSGGFNNLWLAFYLTTSCQPDSRLIEFQWLILQTGSDTADRAAHVDEHERVRCHIEGCQKPFLSLLMRFPYFKWAVVWSASALLIIRGGSRNFGVCAFRWTDNRLSENIYPSVSMDVDCCVTSLLLCHIPNFSHHCKQIM